MTVGEVVINESVQLDGKLDKVTGIQPEIMVYTIEKDGSQSKRVYSYASENCPPPTISTNITSAVSRDVSTTASLPSVGAIVNGNFSANYTLGTTVISAYCGTLPGVSVPYTHANGLCNVTYISCVGSNRFLLSASTSASVTNNVLNFNGGFALSNSATVIMIVGISF